MLEILKGGTHSTIQDDGRSKFRGKGIPVSGAMDSYAHYLANNILGNNDGEAVIEFVFQGPTLKFHRPTTIVLTGADFNAKKNGQEIPTRKRIRVKTGDVIELKTARNGVYGYLGISGRFLIEKKFESQSYYPNICEKTILKTGMKLDFIGRLISSNQNAKSKIVRNYLENLEVLKGPEFHLLPDKQKEIIENEAFVISNHSNRMSIQLEHNFELGMKDILTVPVQPGVIQMTPSGKLMALMQDAQTTGGYARVLILTEESRSLLAQKQPRTEIEFRLV